MAVERKLLGVNPSGGGVSLDVDDVFSIDVYTGTSVAKTITNGIDLAGEGGMVWIKRSDGTPDHNLYDTNRGVGKYLRTSIAHAANTNATYLNAFNADGFGLGADIGGYANYTTFDYASWTFRKAPTFFDVVSYTGNGVAGRTVAHSLGAVPEMMWVKCTDFAYDWTVYHKSLGNTKYLRLNEDQSELTTDGVWDNTTPDDSEFTLGDGSVVSANTNLFIAYLFTSLAGVSKVGSYTGNGTNQTIACGFSAGARFILIKRTDALGDWYVWDSSRGIIAGNDPHLSVNTTAGEVTSDDSVDPANSGFIVNQVSATNINVSSGTYIFYAIA